jgi:disulfide bond formation protein DsbB
MSEDQLSPIIALLALLTAAGSVALAVSISAPGAYNLRATLIERGRWLSFIVAAGAMSGSLYYSEVANFVPCEFCWYQRIAMYPLAAILLIAAITRDAGIARYVIPIAAIGLAISGYHYQLQLFPEQSTVCTSGVPCTVRYVDAFGFVSIPFMAGCGFLSILALQVATLRARQAQAA